MPDNTYEPKIYLTPNGNRQVFKDGAYRLRSVNAAVTAAGADLAGATALTAEINVVTNANDALGVKLPVAEVGMVIIVKTTYAGKNLIVYPATSGAQINALGAGNAIAMDDVTCCAFVAVSATLWYTLPLLPS